MRTAARQPRRHGYRFLMMVTVLDSGCKIGDCQRGDAFPVTRYEAAITENILRGTLIKRMVILFLVKRSGVLDVWHL